MKETDELMARVLAGDGEGGDAARLAALLRSDPELRRRFGELANIDGQLGVALEDDLRRERRRGAIIEAVRRDDRESFVAGVCGRLLRRRWLLRGAAAAAAVAVLALATMLSLRWAKGPEAVDVATVTRLETIRWGVGPKVAVGTTLTAGARLRFEGGLAELEFGGRGRMIVEGPVDLELRAPDRAILRRGRVVMRVTPPGQGFRVETPKGTVIDLGTEFGVAVGDDGEVETHVLAGRVEAVSDDGSRVTLHRDDALRLGPSGGERINADGGAFYTLMPPRRPGSAGFIHWSLDEDKGLIARARSGGLGSGNPDMVFHAMDEGGAPVWVDGVFGSALRFDGKGGYAESGFRGIAGGKPRTVCFWVKVPEDFSLRQGFAILSWGHFERPGGVWQVSVNPLAMDGPVGRLRVGLHEGQVVGSTDLRDGRWHHVAVVLYGGSRPDVGTHVLLYVDGEFESVSRRALREVRTEVDAARHGVWLGRNVTYTKSDPRHGHGGFFRGEIDELFIFDAALGHADVLRVMEGNE